MSWVCLFFCCSQLTPNSSASQSYNVCNFSTLLDTSLSLYPWQSVRPIWCLPHIYQMQPTPRLDAPCPTKKVPNKYMYRSPVAALLVERKNLTNECHFCLQYCCVEPPPQRSNPITQPLLVMSDNGILEFCTLAFKLRNYFLFLFSMEKW